MTFGNHHIKCLATLILFWASTLGYGQFTTVTSIPGVTSSSSPSDARYVALGTGRTTSYTSTSWSQDDTCYYWLSPNVITGLIRGNNSGSSCVGLNTVTYNSSLSNLTGGVLVYTGVTPYTYLNTGYSWTTAALSVRCTLTVTDAGGSAMAISETTAGGTKYVRADQNFNVKILINVFSPSNGWYPSGGSGNQWIPAIQLFNYLQTPSTYKICTSYSNSFGYIQHNSTPIANDSTACFGQTVTFTSLYTSTSYSRTWTDPTGATADTTTGFSITADPTSHHGWWYLNSEGYANCAAPPDSLYMIVSPDMSVSLAVDSNVNCNGGSDGAVTATTTGGISPLSYTWVGSGATTASITGLTAGTYNVTVTDSIGCTEPGSGITVTEPSALSLTTSVDSNVSCFGLADGVVSSAASGGTSPLAYLWSNAATSNNINGLTAGAYGLTVTDAEGCQDSSSSTVTQPDSLIATVTIDSTVNCFGGSDGGLTVSGTGGTTAYTYSWNTGSTSASITGLSANTYSVTITDANSCTDSGSATITEPSLFVSNAAVDNHVSCFGGSDGVATASGVSMGTNTYIWSNGDTAATATGLAAGTYSVTVTNPNGCFDSSSVTITQPTLLVVSASVDSNVTCFGFSNGGATSTASGGVTPYTYSWSSGATSAVIAGVTAATYIVTITDSNGCFDTASVAITEPADLVVSVGVDSNITCNGLSNGALTAAVTGGITPYAYSWNTGSTSASVSGLSAGTYTLTVSDSNSCTTIETIAVTEPALLVATSSLDSNVSCNGFSDGGVSVAGSGGTTAYSYSWNTGATTASLTGLTANTYSVTITDANNCTDSASVTVTEPAVLVSSAVVDNDVSCFGLNDGQATSSATGGTTPYSYSWSNGATSASAASLAAGTYSVTVTDVNGCFDSSSVTITQPTVLVASASVDSNVTCFGFSNGGGTASATGGITPYSYSWSNGSTSASNSAIVAGTYSVTVTDDNGCTDSASITITQPAALLSTTTVDSNVSCNGLSDGGVSTVASGGTTPYSYLWSSGDTTTVLEGIAAGTYTVTVTDGNGCTETSSGIVTEPAVLVATTTLDSNVSCNGLSDGGASVSGAGGTTPYSFLWNTGSTSTSIAGLTAGTYTVTITDNNDCTDDATVTVTEPGVLSVTVSLDSNVSCFGYSNGGASSAVSGGTTPYAYSWSNGATTSFITGVVANTYTLTVTDANNCVETDLVGVGTTPDTVNPTIVCPGNDTLITDGSCQITVPDYTSLAVTSDNCDTNVVVTQSPAPSTVLTGLGAVTITLTATDDSLNTSDCSFTLMRIDTMAPSIACPDDDTLYLGSSCTVLLPDYTGSVTTSDECTNVTVTQSPISGTVLSTVSGTITVTLTAIDSSGNFTTCSMFVTTLDTTSPAITSCVPDDTVAVDGNCEFVVPDYSSQFIVNDNCTSPLAITQSLTAGTIVTIGTFNITMTATDSSGNSSSCDFDLMVSDSTAPVLTCPGDTLLDNDLNACGAVVNYTAPTAIDNCTQLLPITQVSGLPSGSLFPIGVTVNTFAISDTAGNTDTCSFTVTVIDTAVPIFVCPSDTTLSNDPDSCGAVFTFNIPDVYDNCGIDSLYQTQGPASGSLFPVGNTLLEFKAVDSNGLQTFCSYTVTVIDTQSPQIFCVSDTVFCDTFLNYTFPFATDNCGIDTIIQIAGLPPGAAFPIGDTTNTFVAIDTSGNTDTCSFVATRDEEITESIEAGPDQRICDVQSAVLAGASPSLGIGVWSSLGTATVDDSLLNASGVSNLVYDSNLFVWTVTNGTCPSVSDTVVIQIDETPTTALAGDDQDLCEEFETFLDANEPTVGVGIWYHDGSASIVDTLDPMSDISDLSMGINEFRWVISNGVCTPSEDDVIIDVKEFPILEVVEDFTIFEGISVQLEATADIEVSFSWSPTFGLDNPNIANPQALVDETTTYVVEAQTPESCVAMDTVVINVIELDDIYNGITPNGDGINDTWIVFGIENYPDSRITLFNRQGSLVFEAEGYQNDFDGTYKGKKLPAATYYFVIELNDGFTKPFDGNLTIIY